MRPTPVLLRGQRPYYEQTMKIPFKPTSTIALKNEVSNRSRGSGARPCLQELGAVLQCFKDHDCNETRCADALFKLNECYSLHKENEAKSRENFINKITGNSSGASTKSDIKTLLKKFPTK